MTDEQILEEYNKEIYGKTAKYGEMTAPKLIESHRYLRKQSGEIIQARINGYNAGYEWGVKNAAANFINIEELRKMTIQDLANLIGTE